MRVRVQIEILQKLGTKAEIYHDKQDSVQYIFMLNFFYRKIVFSKVSEF